MGRYENYRLANKLGEGGLAEVFEAMDRRTNEMVALKRALLRDPYAIMRMKHEIDVQTRVRHPNIMPILDSDATFAWYTMPRAARVLGDLTPPISDQILFEIVEQCVNGLAAAHEENSIHRDITPNNIMQLCENGETRWVVADWGLVRQHGRTTIVRTIPHGTFGTEGFAAPELWDEPHMADSRADVYGLGRVVGWALTGTWPKPNYPIKNIPPKWIEFVNSTTALEREDRAQDMGVVLALLEQTKNWIEEEAVSGRTKVRSEKFQPYLKELILYLWNEGAPREVTRKEMLENLSEGAYGNHSKLSYAPWSLVEDGPGRTRRLTDKGIRFVQGLEAIPRRIIKDSVSEEWITDPNAEMILITDIKDNA